MNRELWTAADGSACVDETTTDRGHRLRLLVDPVAMRAVPDPGDLGLAQLLDVAEAAQLGSALVAWALAQRRPVTSTIPGQITIDDREARASWDDHDPDAA